MKEQQLYYQNLPLTQYAIAYTELSIKCSPYMLALQALSSN